MDGWTQMRLVNYTMCALGLFWWYSYMYLYWLTCRKNGIVTEIIHFCWYYDITFPDLRLKLQCYYHLMQNNKFKKIKKYWRFKWYH